MALSLADYRLRVHHVLGGDPASEYTSTQIVNEAGRAFVDSHEWKFLERSPVTLDFTASVNYVDLPSDFAQLIAIEITSSNFSAVQMLEFGYFAKYQAFGGTATPGGVFATIVHPGQTSTSSSPGVPRMLLSPTPQADLTDALRIYYRAGWTELANDADIPNIPLYCESILTQFVQAVALGYEEQDAGMAASRIETIVGSTMFANLVYRSGLAQHDYGPELRGAVGTGKWVNFISAVPAMPS